MKRHIQGSCHGICGHITFVYMRMSVKCLIMAMKRPLVVAENACLFAVCNGYQGPMYGLEPMSVSENMMYGYIMACGMRG